MNNMTTFERASVGDKVWLIHTREWGTIAEILPGLGYALKVNFDGGDYISFTMCGKECTSHSYQSLFWDEIPIIAPPKPLPKLEVDTKVLVWDIDKRLSIKRYFSHFDEDGMIHVFARGATSWSNKGNTASYNHWELA